MLKAASVVGTEFTLDVLTKLLKSHGGGKETPAMLYPALMVLTRRNFIKRRGHRLHKQDAASLTFSFVHDSVQEAVVS